MVVLCLLVLLLYLFMLFLRMYYSYLTAVCTFSFYAHFKWMKITLTAFSSLDSEELSSPILLCCSAADEFLLHTLKVSMALLIAKWGKSFVLMKFPTSGDLLISYLCAVLDQGFKNCTLDLSDWGHFISAVCVSRVVFLLVLSVFFFCVAL